MSSGYDLRPITRQHAIHGPAPAPKELSSIESTRYATRRNATRRNATQRNATQRPGVKFFDSGLAPGQTKTCRQRRGASLQRPLFLDAVRPVICFRIGRRVTAKGRYRLARFPMALTQSCHCRAAEFPSRPPRHLPMQAVSLRQSRRCFSDALDQVQRCQHEHPFRLGLDAEEVALLELAEHVGEQLLLGWSPAASTVACACS